MFQSREKPLALRFCSGFGQHPCWGAKLWLVKMTFIRYPHANCRLLIQESYTTGPLSSLFYRKGKRGSDKSRRYKSGVRIWTQEPDFRTHSLKLYVLPGYENTHVSVYFRMTTLTHTEGLANQKPLSTPLLSYVPPSTKVDKTKHCLSQTLLQLRRAV